MYRNTIDVRQRLFILKDENMPFNDVFIMQLFNELKKTKYKIWALKLLCLKENWMYLRTESWFWSFHEGYEWNNRCAHFCMVGISISNKTSIIYCSLCNFSVFRPYSRAQGLWGKFERTMRYWPIIVPTDTESVSLLERIAAENKYLRKGREIKQMIDVMTGRFYIVIFFHEMVPRQCRFRIPDSISKRVHRIKG